jgi:hypothetical protein
MFATYRPLYRTLLFAILPLLPIGCGDKLNRQAVSGTVTYKGKPILRGTVTFAPLEAGGPTYVSAAIEDGNYSIPKENGPVPGKYQVRFEALDKLLYGPAIAGDPAPPPKKLDQEPLPAKYGAASRIEAEVKASAENVLDFALR